jgi:hypothetical protein
MFKKPLKGAESFRGIERRILRTSGCESSHIHNINTVPQSDMSRIFAFTKKRKPLEMVCASKGFTKV